MATGNEASVGLTTRVFDELGLTSLYESSRDIKLLCMQRFVRLFAYGASTLILVSYLEALDISKIQIGLFMTLTLAGDICISFLLTLFADGIGRKWILVLGSLLMTASGIVFATSGNFWVLLVAAIFGVISPSGSEIGPFRAIEESIVAHLTKPKERAHIYAWYGLYGSAGTAFGMLTGGIVIDRMLNVLLWDKIQAYRLIFWIYSGVGLLKTALALLLSSRVELEKKPQAEARPSEVIDETAPLLHQVPTSVQEPQASKPKTGLRSLLPAISKESVSIVIELCLLFAIDSFASGLASISWLTYFFHTHFHLDEATLGRIFLVTSLVTAASMLVAASLAKRFGNVIIMVATHLPSSLCLIIIPLFSNVHWSLVFLTIRACTQSMDTPPRAAFLAMVILPSERTAIMGTINVVKTASQTMAPLITGVLADRDLLWVSFIIAGSLKATYDLGLLAMFRTREKAREAEDESATS